jgi:hypothetical protein
LALNHSIFYYEILNSPDRAIPLAQQALDDALSELDSLSEDSTRIARLLGEFLQEAGIDVADELLRIEMVLPVPVGMLIN